MSAEAECIRQCNLDITLLSLVEGKVHAIIKILIIIALFVIDCRRYYSVLKGQHCQHCLQSTGSTKKMSCH